MRKTRIIENQAVYHVVERANRGEFILNSDLCKEMFIEVLKRAKKKYPYKLQIVKFLLPLPLGED